MSIFRRCKVIEIIDKSIKVKFDGEENPHIIPLSTDNEYLLDCVWEGVYINIEINQEKNTDCRIILQPDYMIDISSIASCFNEIGPNALHYIYNLVIPSPPSAYNLLGNTVNLFFDDKVQDSSRTYNDTLQKTFHDDAIQFLAVDEDELKKVYFNTISDHYNNVKDVVERQYPLQTPALHKENGVIEPSFICPELGISGRMDYLEMHSSSEASIIELKSGKRDEFRRASKPSHLIQTLLYAEVLHYCQDIDYENIHTYLLYNKYPLLSKENYSRILVNKALKVRNQIIGYLHQIIVGEGEKLFTPEAVEGLYNTGSKLWNDYIKPALIKEIRVISDAKPVMKQWFFSQLQFILREEELSRLGAENATFNDRSAANIWRNDFAQKCSDGKIISPMTVAELILDEDEEVNGFLLNINSQEEFSSHDFRKGDSIILYPIDTLETKANEKIIMRANIVSIEDKKMEVALRNSERKTHFADLSGLQFACEHDIINSSVAHACRATYMMLLAPEKWQKLLIENEIPENDEYRLIVGPPGTGKTSVYLRNIISKLYNETNENILLLSFTHRAVDEICSALEDIIENDNAFMNYCRLGSDYDCNDERYKQHLMSYYIDNCKKRSELMQKIKDTRLFVSTTSRMNINHALFDIKSFDTIIVDESSQLLDYQFIELLSHAKRFILIGDHKQLPAVTLQQSACSLFERLYILNKEKNPDAVEWLSRQGRMHPDIAQFANEMFYGKRLEIIPLPHQQETESVLPRYQFFDIKPYDTELFSTTASSKCNPAEALAVALLVKRITGYYQTAKMEFTAKSLGIIVPYRNQISAIRKKLANQNIDFSNINIDTVERYQGSQRDIIIFSATVSTPFQLRQLSAPIEIDGQQVDRKLNVIITRARKHLFIIGNGELLSTNPIYKTLIGRMMK